MKGRLINMNGLSEHPDRPPGLGWKHLDESCQVFKCLVTVELIARLNKTRAGELLNVSVPALNGRIKTLEKLLRGPVFDGRRCNALTPIGREVRKLWSPQLRQFLESFLTEIERLHDQNDLRISADKSIWLAYGKRVETAYGVRLPLGAIHTSFEDGHIAIENRVREGAIDLGLVSFLNPDEKIAAPVKRHFWRNETMVLVVARERAAPLSTKIQVGRDDFRGIHDTFVTMPEDSRMYSSVSAYLKRLKIGRCFSYRIPAQDAAAALEQVIDDRGVSILPERVAAEAEAQGKVASFLLMPQLQQSLDFLYRENSLKIASIQSFLECLEDGKSTKTDRQTNRQKFRLAIR
jgi:DNA-binding transcriptional LysR family regulator